MRLLLALLLLATCINYVYSFSPPSWSLQSSKLTYLTIIQLAQSANDNVGEFHLGNGSRSSSHGRTSYISEISRRDLEERKLKGWRIPQGPVKLSSPTVNAEEYWRVNDKDGRRVGNRLGNQQQQIDSSLDSIGAVYSSLESMTNLLREMRTSQTLQAADVKGLSRRMVDMTSRLDGIEGRRVGKRTDHDDNNVDVARRKREDVSVRIAHLEAELDRIDRLDTVIDDYDDERLNGDSVVIASANNNDLAVTIMRVAQLEAELDRIDSTVRSMEERLNAQGEFVDMIVQEGTSRFPDPRPPPPSSFVERRDILFSPPPEGRMIDDDSVYYYQERNYHRGSNNNSVNERSRGHYYDQPNTSFVSAFSKADNDRRREFHPFANSRRVRQQNTISANVNEMPTRGIWSTPGSGGSAPRDNSQRWGSRRYNWEYSPPPPQMDMDARMMFPEYYDNMPYIDEDGPMMIEDYYDNNNMYENTELF